MVEVVGRGWEAGGKAAAVVGAAAAANSAAAAEDWGGEEGGVMGAMDCSSCDQSEGVRLSMPVQVEEEQIQQLMQ